MKGFNWNSEFVDREKEKLFFDENGQQINRRMQYVCCITGIAYLLAAIADYYELGAGTGFYTMLGGRLVMASFAVITFFLFIIQSCNIRLRKIFLCLLMSSTILCEALEVCVKSYNFTSAGAPIALFIILTFYLFLPPWVYPSLIAGCGGGLAFICAVLFATESGLDASIVITLCFMLANAFGIYFLYSFNVTKRSDFFAHLELKRKADFDDLTQVFCRRKIMELGQRYFSLAKRYETPFSTLILDIDHFKEINDSFGHQTGDRVLRDVAGIFRNEVREGDLVGRIGGEEFVVFLPNTNAVQAAVVADRICRSVESYQYPEPEIGVRVTISIGSAELIDLSDLHTLLKNADSALYKAKDNGRNQVCWYGA
ncbi:GGDEF domain-containing protein [Desulfovibrio sp. JC010]|uniref:GGDEF domain-containing protein n=1 Tax=Desulfovibrio sp. JC010 TaxID=2593641 RepID=UPI0013D48DA8|nr:GGDEF domain-containing protein [Desulfovibrio sp. JC010]NDV27849.1 GGDEF domain-containing protein [Desulfovibrio sp. JC010]